MSADAIDLVDLVEVPKRTRRLFIAVSLIVLGVYLFSARGVPMVFDEAIVADTTAALAHGRVDIHTPLLQKFPGLAVQRSDGRKVGIYGIGTSIVGLPPYLVGKAIAQISPAHQRAQIVLTATMFTNAFVVAATVFMLMLVSMLLRAPPVGAVLVGLSYGLGSYAFPHALTLFTEPGTAFCVLTAVYYAIRAARGGARAHLIASGAWAGTALLFRVSAVLFLPILGLWLLVAAWRSASAAERWPRVFTFGAWFTAGAIGPLLAMCFFNWWRYGSVTNLGYGLGSATDQSYPIVRGVVGQWFSSGKSIFLFAPIAIIVVCGLYRSVRRMPMEMLLLGAIVVVNTLFFARVQFWSGDWAWGPRYLQIVVPCLAAMAAPLMDSVSWRRALIVVSVLGFCFAALPAVMLRYTTVFFAAFKVMPPETRFGPTHWDHSYYALIWHTAHWQQILYQLRLLPKTITHSFHHVTNPLGPVSVTRAPETRVEFWLFRARDLGNAAVLGFTLLALAAVATGARMLVRYRRETPA